jgi:hypothetical protein
MKQNSAAPARTRAVASGQNDVGRMLQVRSNTSGSTSIAMSQRTPSHCPAMVINCSIIAACMAGLP